MKDIERYRLQLSEYCQKAFYRRLVSGPGGNISVRIPGTDTEAFKKLQAALAEKPATGDYFTLDQFWKKRIVFEFTPEEVATIDRCLYDIPNFDGAQLPQIRYKFWPKAVCQN